VVRFAPGAGPDVGTRSALRSLGPIVSLFADLALATAESRGILRMRTRFVETLASGASIAAESIRQLLFSESDSPEPAAPAAPEPALATAPPDGWPFRSAEARFDPRDVVGRMRGWLGAFLASRGSALRIAVGSCVPRSIPGTAELFGTALFELLEALTNDRTRSPVLVRIDGSPDGTELLLEAGFETPAGGGAPSPTAGRERPLWLAPLFFLRRGGRFDERALSGAPPRSVRGRMPCAEAAEEAAPGDCEPLPVRTPSARPAAAADAPLVLVVDDEVYARYTIRCLLEREGFRVETASDGEEGLAAATSLRPAIVIMDLSMPRCDGLEAARRMRAEASLRTLPLLAMTARSRETAVQEALEAGFDGIIQKPFFLPELLSVVRHWLGDGSTAAPASI
jgi:CheY-like chemotaxis protein